VTNHILEKVADALRQANEELYSILKFNPKDHTWEIWVDSKPYLVNIKSHHDAEARCENLNYRYAATKAIESLNIHKMTPNSIYPTDLNTLIIESKHSSKY